MNKEEFIGKLQMVYVGDRNAFNEIVEDNQRLKNELVYSKVEIDRLNNIINGLEKWAKEELEHPNWASCGARCMLDKLKALKENNKDV